MIDTGSGRTVDRPDLGFDEGDVPRVLGTRGRAGGRQLIVVVAIHGNEPAGIRAAQRVLEELDRRELELDGRMVALIGNRTALAAGKRHLDTDLNRLWTERQIAEVYDADARGQDMRRVEERELLELHRIVDETIGDGGVRPICLDLHSTSGLGRPFVIMSDTLRNRRVGFALQIPVLLGLEEQIEGTILQHFGDRCEVALAIEGGQHDDPRTVDHLESTIWCALVAGGLLDESALPEVRAHRERLRAVRGEVPSALEVFHRHSIPPGVEFRMEPGFESFARVQAGQLLAHTSLGPVDCPRDAILLMPLYQGQGSDGFFLGKPIAGFWLWLSAALRRLRLDRLMRWLPGVHRESTDSSLARVDQKIARWYAREIFHLFGFRYCGTEEGRLVFRRRAE